VVTCPHGWNQFSHTRVAADAAPALISAGLLAMQGRYLGMPRKWAGDRHESYRMLSTRAERVRQSIRSLDAARTVRGSGMRR
jgi:hypothetical protein